MEPLTDRDHHLEAVAVLDGFHGGAEAIGGQGDAVLDAGAARVNADTASTVGMLAA